MSEFEEDIRLAKARQRRLYTFTFFTFFCVTALLAGLLVFISGTPIKISPVEAQKTGTIKVVDGFAIAYKSVVYGLFGTPTINVGANGFRQQKRTIGIEERGNKVEVTLTPVPGKLVATTLPALDNTKWILDGDLVFVGKIFTSELEHGSYVLQIDNPYFQVENRSFKVYRAEKQEINIELTPVNGLIKILSDPSNATVSIDGKNIGKTPNEFGLKGGAHDIILKKDGYETVQEIITLTNTNDSVDRAYKMKLVKSTLKFIVEPKGGQLLLNGQEIPPSGSYEVDSKTRHTVTYALEGFYPLTRNITLNEAEEKRISLLLTPEFGKVDISVFPPAEIYVDGTKVGKGIANLTLSAVPHIVEFRKKGYRTIKKKFRPSSSHTTLFKERLVTELSARMAESPKEYKNSVGIELKLFEPNSFKMGAPRHQQGQRANEFEKNVILKKAFYASKREITNAQFKLYSEGHSGPANQPVVSLTWVEAAGYCNWLSKREDLLPFYNIVGSKLRAVNINADGYRLLTEAEWEWLARKAGRKEQTLFPWGNDAIVPKKAGNIADESANGLTRFYVPGYNDGFKKLASVGEFPAENSGLFDLTGNASEWVNDFYSLTPPDQKKLYIDPLGPEFGEGHVVKGSSWRSGTRTQLRASFREGLSQKRSDVGFRIGRYLYAAEAISAK